MNSAIQLPSALVIGFTGHRDLADEPKCRTLICDYLRERKAATSGIICGVSSAAAGGDLLFAESCIELGIPLRVLLPLPQEDFQKDFDTATWLRAEQVLSKAVSVEVTGNHELREEGYYECGIETVQQSQLMIALWDGEPSRGMGGTQEIVAFAKKMGRPVVWFHSVTGTMQVFNKPALQKLLQLHDPELDFLNSLPDSGVMLSTDSPAELARAWFQKIDKNASRLAPQVRRLASIPIVYTAAAAFFSGAALQMPHAETWLAIGTALGVTAAALPVALRLSQRQARWARSRTAAEVCRSILALWSMPVVDEVIGPEIIPELASMLMSLKLLKALDGARNGISIDEFKERYRRERVSDQLEHFSQHAMQSAHEARRYRVVTWICTGLAILIAAGLFLITAEFKNAYLLSGKRWLTVAVTALFQLATISGAMLIVKDCKRRQQRYRELHGWLKEWDTELDALRTWPTVLKVVCRVERALLVELLEWKSLVQNVKLPRK
ncbi:MAG: hypothetical protein ABSB30_11865 [Terracidiphilus sp.]|jgi:hypothetical protein